MPKERYRYFIELQPPVAEKLPRHKEQEIRRSAALEFVRSLREWLQESGMTKKVGAVDVTLFGQVLITCETDVIDFVREQDVLNIAAIRQAASLEKISLSRARLSA